MKDFGVSTVGGQTSLLPRVVGLTVHVEATTLYTAVLEFSS